MNFIVLIIEKILSVYFSILMIISPTYVTYSRQMQENDFNLWAPKIAAAFSEKDVDALEGMLCDDIKEETENLPEIIQEMFDKVDGEFTEVTWKIPETPFYGDMHTFSASIVNLYLTADGQTYRIEMLWAAACTYAPEETKIRAIVIHMPDFSDNIELMAQYDIPSSKILNNN